MVSKTFTHDRRGNFIWYIRTKKGSKTFYVKKYGSKEAAEKAADAFITEYIKDHPDKSLRKINFRRTPSKNSTSGIAGVYRTAYRDHGKMHNYWCANIPLTVNGSRNVSKRFCVETLGENKAKEKAIKTRKKWELEHK